MARKKQPYLPLYAGDWLSEEKLKMVSMAAHGLLVNIMLTMHKSDTYGKILLKQKFKQKNAFASQLACLFAWTESEILLSLNELMEEGLLIREGDLLINPRMVRDHELSLIRSKAGKSGGNSTQSRIKKGSDFAKAKVQANADIDIDINNTPIEHSNEGERLDLTEKSFEVRFNIHLTEKEKPEGFTHPAFFYNEEIVPEFEDWWKMYGREQGQIDTEVRWYNLSDSDQRRAYAHTYYLVPIVTDPQFRSKPQKYLFKREFEDVIIDDRKKPESALKPYTPPRKQ